MNPLRLHEVTEVDRASSPARVRGRARRIPRGGRRRLAGAALGAAVVLAACGTGAPTAGTMSSSTSSTVTTAPSATTPGSRNPAAVAVRVWFLDDTHAATGQEPLYRPVVRMVHPPGVASAALDALFAGPTAAERAEGFRLVTSGATGYRNLHIADGVARVTLVGGCASGGSTMTIAGELMPTLKQFATVTHVKIYAPDGSTEEPGGTGDSVPFCLEP